MDEIQRTLLEEVADLHGVPAGAYNIRANGRMAGRQNTANIEIITKEDQSGIEIRIKEGTKHESVHIPVVLSQSGLKEMVYNDFYIGEGADVTIVAGCGIHNSGDAASEHDGIHRFFCGQERPGPLCGKALRGRRRPGRAYFKPHDGGDDGGGQLSGNGIRAD